MVQSHTSSLYANTRRRLSHTVQISHVFSAHRYPTEVTPCSTNLTRLLCSQTPDGQISHVFSAHRYPTDVTPRSTNITRVLCPQIPVGGDPSAPGRGPGVPVGAVSAGGGAAAGWLGPVPLPAADRAHLQPRVGDGGQLRPLPHAGRPHPSLSRHASRLRAHRADRQAPHRQDRSHHRSGYLRRLDPRRARRPGRCCSVGWWWWWWWC